MYGSSSQAASSFVLHRLRPESVIAIPLPTLIQGLQEKIRSFHLLKQAITILSAPNGIAQRDTQLVEHAGLQQKIEQGQWAGQRGLQCREQPLPFHEGSRKRGRSQPG